MTDKEHRPSAAPLFPSLTHHSWVRYAGPVLFFWAACTIPSHTEAVSAPSQTENDPHSIRLIGSHQQHETPQHQRHQRQRRRRRAQDDVPTVEDMLDSAIESEETPCFLNENGFYGSPAGGNIVATASYLYQVSVVPGTTKSELEDVILPELERAFPTAVLPVFFPECNSNNNSINAGHARRQLQSSNERRVLAISMMPPDSLVMEGQSKLRASISLGRLNPRLFLGPLTFILLVTQLHVPNLSLTQTVSWDKAVPR